MSINVYAGGVGSPQLPKGKGEQCVEATPEMQRNHMNYLLHKRDQTMHQGIRTKQYSLIECIDCHVSKDEQDNFIPINAEGQFCQACHSYAAVSIDCFQCHATTPDKDKQASATSLSHSQEMLAQQQLKDFLAAQHPTEKIHD